MFVKSRLSLHFVPADIGPVNLVTTEDGPALEFGRGPINIYDLIRDYLIMNEVVNSAHIDQFEGDRLRWSMDSNSDLYDVLCSRGVAGENDEDNGDAEDDNRSLPLGKTELREWWGSAGSAVSALGAPGSAASPDAAMVAPPLAA